MRFSFSIVTYIYRSSENRGSHYFCEKNLRLENVPKKKFPNISHVPKILLFGKFASLDMPTYPTVFKYICAVCTGFKTIRLRQDQRPPLQSSQRYSSNTR